ncbi:MAG: ChuX/HutX family heme-like substrate-binding protein [Verrucomicrobiota bacterium]
MINKIKYKIGFDHGAYPGLRTFFPQTTVIDKGVYAITLLPPWSKSFELMHGLGGVYNMTFHGPAVVGKLFQELFFIDLESNVSRELDGTLEINRGSIGHIMAVEEIQKMGVCLSLQIFNKNRTGLHKVCLTDQSEIEHFHKIINELSALPYSSYEDESNTRFDERSWQNDQSLHDLTVEERYCESDPIHFRTLNKLLKEASKNDIAIEVELFNQTIEHKEVFCNFSIAQEDKALCLIQKGVEYKEYMLQYDLVGKVVLAKSITNRNAPTSIRVYGKCGCHCSTIAAHTNNCKKSLGIWHRAIFNHAKTAS